MKRRGYDIGRVVDLIFEYWLGRMKDSELEEYRHMKETTGLDKYAREFEDREWIKNALEEPDIFETDKAYRRFWSMTAGKRSIGRLRWRWVASLLIPLLVGGGVGLFVWWQPASIPLSEDDELYKNKEQFGESLETEFIEKEEVLYKKQFHEKIMAALSKKNPRWYEAIILVYYMDIPQVKVAEIMEIRKEVLHALLHRAKKWIRKKFGAEYEEMQDKDGRIP